MHGLRKSAGRSTPNVRTLTIRGLFDGKPYLHRKSNLATWVDLANTEMEYSALLTRVSREYDRRFL